MERFSDCLHTCGPYSWPSLWASTAELDEARALVARAAADRAAVHPATLLASRRLLAAVLHPDTGQPIALPFRMAAHVPVNALLLAGMVSARSPAATAAWQAINATFNAAQFFANRNRSNTVRPEHVAASYVGAMVSSVGVAFALRRHFIRAAQAAAHLHTRRAAYLGAAAVPYLAAVAGKPLQIGCMRADELSHGVTVFDADGLARGNSAVAGRSAVGQTILSRVVYLAPMLWLPLLQDAVEATVPVVARSALLRGASIVALAAASSAVVTPACMALYEQRACLPVSALEPALRGLTTAAGQPVTHLYFNKGL